MKMVYLFTYLRLVKWSQLCFMAFILEISFIFLKNVFLNILSYNATLNKIIYSILFVFATSTKNATDFFLISYKQHVRVPISLYLCQYVSFCLFFIVILVGVKWHHIIVLICIFLVIDNIQHSFICLLATCTPSLKKHLFILLPCFFFSPLSYSSFKMLC